MNNDEYEALVSKLVVDVMDSGGTMQTAGLSITKCMELMGSTTREDGIALYKAVNARVRAGVKTQRAASGTHRSGWFSW